MARWLLLAVLGWALLGAQAGAAERIALLIGNNDYTDPNARLTNAASDARALGDRLQKLGFKVLLRTNADSKDFKNAIREFTRELGDAKTAVFFYAGHALQSGESNYLLPVDAMLRSAQDVRLDGINIYDVVDPMNDARTRNIVILDACRDNPFKDRFKAATGLAKLQTPPDTLVAYSTAPGSVAYDGTGPNGIYTKHLLKRLDSPTDDVAQMFSKVGKDVEAETQSKQRPIVESTLREQLRLVAAAAPAASAPTSAAAPAAGADGLLNAERAYWESVRKDDPDELQDYLTKFGKNGFYAGIAQRRLASLESARQPATAKLDAPRAAPVEPQAPAAPKAASEPKPAPVESKAEPKAKGEPKLAVQLEPERKPAPNTGGASAAPGQLAMNNGEPRSTSASGSGNGSVALGTQPAPTGDSAKASLPPIAMAPKQATVPKPESGAGAPPASASPTGSTRSLRYPDGSSYSGEFRGSVPYGHGEYVGPNGDRYKGEFVDGRWEGKGRAEWKDGSSYEGDFTKGVANGTGVMRLPGGDTYRGTVRDGVPEGSGVIEFANGGRYEGAVVRGQPAGQGKMKFPSGDYCEGEFVNGVLTGKGLLRLANGDVYQGQFVQGRADGQARLVMKSGDSYDGQFKEHVFHGHGLFRYANGMKFDGQFVSGVIQGDGLLTYADGRKFEGRFQQGLKNAKGVTIEDDGRRIPSEIIDGLLRPTN